MHFIKTIILFGLLGSLDISVQAQSPLDGYIIEALEHNGLIKEQKAWIEEKKAAENLANKQRSPEINFGTGYTLAAGGRTIGFPIGDLLNPVSDALNDLTRSNRFPSYENQTVQFLPNNFYDARVRTSIPILEPGIKTNQVIKKEQVLLQEIQYQIAERDVIQDVKKAYYLFVQAGEMIKILNQSLVFLDESERVSRSLIKNGIAIPSTIMRLESERSKINTQIYATENQRKDAAEYFNFLRGKPADEPIESMPLTNLPDPRDYENEIKNEEVKLLDKNLAIQQLALDLEHKYHAPRLGAQVDVGSQNFNFKYGGYVLAGLQLDIPLWNNKKNVLKQNEIKAGMNAVNEKKDWAIKGIHLQTQQAHRQLETCIHQYQSYTPLLQMVKKYHVELMKKYKEGQANQVEIIDALSQITYAETQQSIALFQAWIKAAELERLLSKTDK